MVLSTVVVGQVVVVRDMEDVVMSNAVVGSTGVVASFVVGGLIVVKRAAVVAAVVVAGSVDVKPCPAVDVISTVGLTVVVASLAVVD